MKNKHEMINPSQFLNNFGVPMNNDLLYRIAITLIPGVGDVNGKTLIAYCGSPEAVFSEKKPALLKIPGIGTTTVNSILSHDVFHRAEEEIVFIEKNEIEPLFYLDNDYPARLLNCADGPMMLYYKGTASLNTKRVISVVGTRRATNYGKRHCDELIRFFRDRNVLVVSGLAYGIDSCAHRKSFEYGIETVGVLGHGLDRIYPAQNRKLAAKMLEHGGLLTEFRSNTKPDRENFPKRNRIVAGMADAVVVIESGRRGGALITAELANSYNRDVFAIPGRLDDEMSQGCNFFIKTNRAALCEKGEDIAYIMGWDDKPVAKKRQPELFINLSDEESSILNLIREHKEISVDQIVIKSGYPTSKVAEILLNLEFEGIVRSQPGKIYTV